MCECLRRCSSLHTRVRSNSHGVNPLIAGAPETNTHPRTQQLPPVECPCTDSSLPLFLSPPAKPAQLRHLKRTLRTCGDSYSQTHSNLGVILTYDPARWGATLEPAFVGKVDNQSDYIQHTLLRNDVIPREDWWRCLWGHCCSQAWENLLPASHTHTQRTCSVTITTLHLDRRRRTEADTQTHSNSDIKFIRKEAGVAGPRVLCTLSVNRWCKVDHQIHLLIWIPTRSKERGEMWQKGDTWSVPGRITG